MPPMEDEKAEKISISVPSPILTAMERHLKTLPRETRSSWLTDLATRELESAGALGESAEVAKITAKVAAAVRKDPTLTARIESIIGKSTRRQLAPA